jgi:DNA-binding response OmpR family regulator
MVRPALLVAEPEPSDGLSTRKLVLETAKFNVVTAHSTEEAIEAYQLFPAISAAILVASPEVNCEAAVQAIRQSEPPGTLPIVALSPRIGFMCDGVDYTLPSRDPHALLELVRSLLGDPRQLDSPDQIS